MNLQIIHEDNDILLCHKPAGVATQTKRLGQQDMESFLKNYRAKKGEQPYIGAVHRLDQPVEGIMVFAKNQAAAASLSKQVQQRMIGKYYYAVSTHAPANPEGVLEDYLLTDKKTNYTTVVEFPASEERTFSKGATMFPENAKLLAKKAKLEYRIVESAEEATLFEIQLHTGRQHQIRVQMAHMGCPLVGDSKYGEAAGTGIGEKGLALCSYRLEFVHPTTGKKMDFSIKPQGEAFLKFPLILDN